MLAPAVLTVLTGCQGMAAWSDQPTATSSAEPHGTGPGATTKPQVSQALPTAGADAELVTGGTADPAAEQPPTGPILGVSLDVLRVDVPLGTLSGNDRFWNQLDEQSLGADRTVLLKRNGLRAAVGRAEAWAPIKAMLDSVDDKMVYREAVKLHQGPLAFQISDGPDDQHVFLYRPDGTMAGASFTASHNLFHIRHRLDEDDPNQVHLTVIPGIRQNQRRLEWAKRGQRLVRVPTFYGRTLHELTMGVRLSPGRFLVIGAGREVALPSVLGRTMLTREVDGKRYESVFLMTPEVIRHAPSDEP